jgi:hypothetical protein
MKKYKFLPVTLLSALLSWALTASAEDMVAKYQNLLQETEAAVAKAASVGGEWRDIRWKKSKQRYLPSAREAAEKGNYGDAIELLEVARFQAEKGYEQAIQQQNAGPLF